MPETAAGCYQHQSYTLQYFSSTPLVFNTPHWQLWKSGSTILQSLLLLGIQLSCAGRKFVVGSIKAPAKVDVEAMRRALSRQYLPCEWCGVQFKLQRFSLL